MTITGRAREILAQHGVDIENLGDAPPINVVDIMLGNAHTALDDLIGGTEHADAHIENPAVTDWIGRFLADELPHPMLLICGPLGTGKTSHCYATLRECLLGRARQQRTLAWQITSHSKFNAAMRPSSDDAHLTAFTRYEQAELLLLDDLGAGLFSEWTADTLYRLVDERWHKRRPTVVTTNYTPEQLVKNIDPRVASRLASGRIVTLKGGDRRRPGVHR